MNVQHLKSYLILTLIALAILASSSACAAGMAWAG
jgi:hypothetical protein